MLDWDSSMGCVKCLTLDIYFSTVLGSLLHFAKHQMLAWDCLGRTWVSQAPTDNSRYAVRSIDISGHYFAGDNQDLDYSILKEELFFPFSFYFFFFFVGVGK